MIVQEKIKELVIEFTTTIGENRFAVLKGNLAGKQPLAKVTVPVCKSKIVWVDLLTVMYSVYKV